MTINQLYQSLEGLSSSTVKPSKRYAQETMNQACAALLHQSTSDLKSSAQHRAKQVGASQTDPVLEALLKSIDVNAEIQKENSESIRVVINYIASQVNSLKGLQDEINALRQKLNENLSPAQIAALEAKLESLREEYENALNREESDQKDINQRKGDNQALEKENQELQKEAAAEKDPAKKEAIENKIAQNNSKIKSNNHQIDLDNSDIEKDNQSIYSVISSLKTLEKQYPSIDSNLDQIIKAMTGHQNLNAAFANLDQTLAEIEKQDTSLQSKLAELQSQLTTLQEALSAHILKVETLVGKLKDYQSSSNEEEDLIKEMKKILLQVGVKTITGTEHSEIENKSAINRSKYQREEVKKRELTRR